MVFLEYYVGDIGSGNFVSDRFLRYYAIRGPGEMHQPPVMTDSTANGTRWHEGLYYDNLPYYYYKRDLVEPEILRPAQAEVTAAMWRVDNHFRFQIKVKNTSGVTLANAANYATVTAVVYEDVVVPAQIDQRISDTTHLVVGAASQKIETPLANGETAIFTVDTSDLGSTHPVHAVNWDKVHGVAFVDYRPAGTTGAYDMLQAATATPLSGPVSFGVDPGSIAFMIDRSDPKGLEKTLYTSGSPDGLTWTATKNADWLAMTPASGSCGNQIQLEVDYTKLPLGRTDANIHLESNTLWGPITQDIPVTVYLLQSVTFHYTYLPLLDR